MKEYKNKIFNYEKYMNMVGEKQFDFLKHIFN